MGYLIGVDIGTLSAKAILMDLDGNIKGIHGIEYTFDIPKEGYAEQWPDVWWDAVVESIKKVMRVSGVNKKDILGIGLSGQMHGAVVLNKSLKAVRPAIIWCDQRSKKEVEYINEKVGRLEQCNITLNNMYVGFQTASLLWIKNNEPDNYDNIYKAITPKDYIRYKLVGEIATDYTDASGTLAFNTTKRAWATDMLSKLELDLDMYPSVYNSFEIAGVLTKSSAEELGLAAGTKVVYGGADQTMQAVGNGVVSPGRTSVTIGTGGQVFAPLTQPLHDKGYRTHTFCNALDNSWFIMGASLSAGLSLRWLRDNVELAKNYEEMSSLANEIPAGSNGLVYLPYLGGDRTPHLDPNARGVFFGLTLKHSKKDIIRSVMEGVAFALKDSISIFEDIGVPTETIIASGGGARSDVWLSIQADIFEREVYVSNMVEQACVGAAIVAGYGVGAYESISQACERTIKLNDRPIEPNMKNTRTYQEQYSIYKQLYDNDKDLMARLSR